MKAIYQVFLLYVTTQIDWLKQEGNDKQFLLKKIAKLEGRDYQSPPTVRRRKQSMAVKEETDDNSTKVEMSRFSSNGYSSQAAPPGVMYDDM